jgi:uncharacterized protein YndB with AHSA1/START domain
MEAMRNDGRLVVKAVGDRELSMTRVFEAPRHLVYAAFTRPELVSRWLGVFGGWTMDVCEMDLRVGGAYRWGWRHAPDGGVMRMGGTYREVVPEERIVATERFDEAWYPGEAVDTTTFVEQGGRTTVAMTVRYASKEAREGAPASPMEHGVATGYDTLDGILAAQLGQGVHP